VKNENINIETAAGTGFCFGVKRAISILEKTAKESGNVETLGAVVHNKQVLQRLLKLGVTVAETIDDVKGNMIAIGAHGVGPEVADKIKKHNLKIVDTTCRFVQRAQSVAQRLSRDGFFVVVYGDVNHPEVKGILAWADSKGIATLDAMEVTKLNPLPKRIGVLAQTTQIPANFNEFVKKLVEITLTKDSELYIVDTICHDIRRRQESAQKLADKVDLMFVVGDHTSANTNRLAELCNRLTDTRLIETAREIKPGWLKEHKHIGITAGASTAKETINEVLTKLGKITKRD
jgi:4-hydroxy-3-methylbut-2-enyl diphosphate reductase